ncbi:hypothetical protein CCACVL1_18594 [Corchorus capsularis]|uniref:Uncharacterized protein n=1 Tax=Corchorus capsularis TaxID=210143 RepID=A0A1R3HKL8_COCAP|nr:hypothetical protein CCACVL1_18594 [Corchorus capsularis]
MDLESQKRIMRREIRRRFAQIDHGITEVVEKLEQRYNIKDVMEGKKKELKGSLVGLVQDFIAPKKISGIEKLQVMELHEKVEEAIPSKEKVDVERLHLRLGGAVSDTYELVTKVEDMIKLFEDSIGSMKRKLKIDIKFVDIADDFRANERKLMDLLKQQRVEKINVVEGLLREGFKLKRELRNAVRDFCQTGIDLLDELKIMQWKQLVEEAIPKKTELEVLCFNCLYLEGKSSSFDEWTDKIDKFIEEQGQGSKKRKIASDEDDVGKRPIARARRSLQIVSDEDEGGLEGEGEGEDEGVDEDEDEDEGEGELGLDEDEDENEDEDEDWRTRGSKSAR